MWLDLGQHEIILKQTYIIMHYILEYINSFFSVHYMVDIEQYV